jgi:uncharacterized protein YbcI
VEERGTRGPERGKMLAGISKAILGIHRQYYGRGASSARTLMDHDYVICFLEDIYTPVERTLIDAGRFEAVKGTRAAFQDTMREKFSASVEEFSGRKVIGFLSQVHVDPDVAIETFILQPDNQHSSISDS